jgi:hypothetical protein
VTVIEGESGSARAFTKELLRQLDARRVPYTKLPGAAMAHQLPLPTVIASYGTEGREVSYQGYGRIVHDFLPRVRSD